MVWILRFLNIIIMIANFWVIFTNPEMCRFAYIAMGFLFFISGLRKAFILGLDNLRGKFWVLLSLTGLFFPLASIFQSDILHIFSRLWVGFMLFFMFMGLRRQGLSLSGNKSTIWLLGVVIVLVLSFLFSQLLPEKTILSYLFLTTLVLNFAILFANALIYFGSDLGRRWLIGFLGFAFFFIADPSYLLDYKYLHYFFLTFSHFFLNIVAHIEE